MLYGVLKKYLKLLWTGGETEVTNRGRKHSPAPVHCRFLSSWTLKVPATGYPAHHDVYVTAVIGREQTVLKNHKNRGTIRQTKRLNFWRVCAGQGADMEGFFFPLAFCVQATIHCKAQARRTPTVFAFVCSFWFFSMTFCKSNIWVWNTKKPPIDRGPRGGELEE